MLKKLTLLVCFCFLLITSVSASEKATDGEYETHWGRMNDPVLGHSLEVFEINLDLPYEQRWKEVMIERKDAMHTFLKRTVIEYIPTGIFDYATYPIARRYNTEFAEEIKALADLSDVSFTKMLLLNYMYDFAAMCSSILVQDSSDNVILARSLDFGLASYIADLAFHAKYYKDGKLLYESIDLAGFLGLVTAFKPNAYSFSINEYFVEDEIAVVKHVRLFYIYLTQILKGKLTAPYIARKAFEQTEDYEGLVKTLEDTESTSRAHYIVSGPKKGQGVVITKFQDRVQNSTSLDAANGRWYIVQTNYVRDVRDPKYDNRRSAATDRLERLGRDAVTVDSLMEKVMRVYPTFNGHSVHATMVQVNKNYFNTTVWH